MCQCMPRKRGLRKAISINAVGRFVSGQGSVKSYAPV